MILKNLKQKLFKNFGKELFLFLKIFLVIALILFWFLFWRIYENWNLSNFLKNKSWDNFTLIKINNISDKWIEWEIKFWSLKILKNWKKFSFDTWKFFIKN